MGTHHPNTELKTREHLLELVKEFDSGILVTHAADGSLHGRPMGVAEMTDSGVLYFSTSTTDPKAAELAHDPRAGLYLVGKTKWVSLAGTATVVQDKARIDRLWNESWKLWFPKGKEDPALALVRFEPDHGEYWDNSGAHGLRFAIEAAKAYIQGREPDAKKMDENAKVNL